MSWTIALELALCAVFDSRLPTTGHEQVLDKPVRDKQPGKAPAKGRDMQPVLGKRRIWGTLKQCNAGAVQRAIHQFSTVPDGSIEVRRKYKTLKNAKHTMYKTLKNAKQRWWYVLKAEEELLQRLDGEWEGVKLQTGWKLEPCLAYKYSPQSPIPSPANAEPSTSSTAVVTNPATASATPISPDLLLPLWLQIHKHHPLILRHHREMDNPLWSQLLWAPIFNRGFHRNNNNFQSIYRVG